MDDKILPLPLSMPGSISLDQAKEAVGAFGYELAMIPKAPPPPPPGFQPQRPEGAV